MRKNKVKKVLKRFDKHFEKEANKRIKNKLIILNVFNQFVNEIYEPSEVYHIAIETKEEIRNQLNLNDEQKKLFKKWEECENVIVNDMAETSFIYGFMVDDELKEESKK